MKIILKSCLIASACFLLGVFATAFDRTVRVKVESQNDRRATKYVGDIRSVRLVRRLSGRPCRQGRSWGYDRNRVWVDDGCRAIFDVVKRTDSRERRTIRVESKDGRRKSVRVDHVGQVRLKKKISDKPCVYGYSWGYTSSTIWVDRGCRGEFEYYRRK